jgi:hypothetical protein
MGSMGDGPRSVVAPVAGSTASVRASNDRASTRESATATASTFGRVHTGARSAAGRSGKNVGAGARS